VRTREREDIWALMTRLWNNSSPSGCQPVQLKIKLIGMEGNETARKV
jgi:hypothetical protein